MSKKIVSLGDFKARKEKAEQEAERREREAQERIYAAPAYKGFLEVMTPTPINPHNMPIVMRNVLFSMEERLRIAKQDDPKAHGVFDMHLRLSGHTFDKAAMGECRDSYEADLRDNDPKAYARIKNKALRHSAGGDQETLRRAVKDAFMDAMIGETYAYRAVAKQLSEGFPGMSWKPDLTPTSPTDCTPTIEISAPVREGHDLRAMLERYLFRTENPEPGEGPKKPPHLKPV